MRRNTLFFEQLHGHLQELASLQLSRCDAPARQQLQALDGRLYLASAGDAQGIQLLLIADATALQASLTGLRLGIVLLAGVLAVLGGALAGLLMRRELSLEKALQQALRRGELEVDYQPLVDLATRRCVGAEALVRWRRADGQRVRPDLFIPQAEASGQICAITQRVIELVMQQMAELLRAHPTLYISVNLAAADIAQGRFVEVARQQLASQGVAARQLVWEVTERGLVDVEQACQLLEQLRQAGHRIAIDDFGTGYSSLSYLQRLPVDVLKIDKSFVDSLGMQAASSSVAPHIIDMARDLGLKVIAEGIESATQADTLQQLGAQVGQGFLFSRPLAASAFHAFVRRHG